MAKALCIIIFAALAWQVRGFEPEPESAGNLISDSDEDAALLQKFKCYEDGLYVNPRNCSTFIQCSNGKAYIMPCPEGLHFSGEKKVCEGPCDAHCDKTIACKCEWPTCGKEACFLPPKVGRCRGLFPRFYFDKRDKVCKKFIYGGCNGNENNFETKEACEKHCGDALGDSTGDVCKQPKKPGPCHGSFPRYYFNQKSGKCEKFIYGGCKGNENNFETEEDCKKRCIKTEGDALGDSTTDVCKQPKKPGPCHGSFPRYYFNQKSGKCEKFVYGGCQRNGNNFETEDECKKRCLKTEGDALEDSTTDVCKQPKKPGPCHGSFPRYYFNQKSGKCERFIYGGCKGNENNFETEDECKERCLKKEELGVMEDFECGKDGLYPNKRNCSTYIQCSNGKPNLMPCPKGLHFSTETNRCEGPCTAKCDRTLACKCKWETCGKKQCLQSPETGSCKEYKRRFAFEKSTGLCKPFLYSGCLGNENNFVKKIDCQKNCNDSINICRLPSEKGTCRGKITRFYFNSKKGKCEKFIWGGCGGNANNFDSVKACELKCLRKSGEPEEEESKESREEGVGIRVPEEPEEEESKESREEGVGIRFPGESSSEEDIREDPITPECHSPPKVGGCFGHFPRWNYDEKQGKCVSFIYGGCHGNGNNYKTEEECLKHCSKHSDGAGIRAPEPAVPKLCELPMEAGSCSGSNEMFYYDSEDGECKSFNYTGCGGNSNRFWTKLMCEKTCKRDKNETSSPEDSRRVKPEPECDSPAEIGKCHARLQRWYYNKEQKKCVKFEYGGCGGNGNRYLTEHQCKKQCSKHSADTVCELPADPGPCPGQIRRYFFNTESGMCEPFMYGGCKGNLNNFPSTTACQKRCLSSLDETIEGAKPARECKSPADPGKCRGSIPRWYYDKKQKKCIQFTYGGCGGNGNNYLSEAQCLTYCTVPSARGQEVECEPGSPNGDFPYIEDCRKYISCKDGKATLKECPKGEAFHFILRECVPIGEAACIR